jgi:hypothetical protein
VLTARDLRALSFACFAFNGVHPVFIAYFVTYLQRSVTSGRGGLPVLSRRVVRAVPHPVGYSAVLHCTRP